MDADRLKEAAEECIRRRDFVEAKALLKKAAELAPLRNDIRDLLFHAAQMEASGGRRRRMGAVQEEAGSSPRIWIWILLWLVSVLAAGAGGFWAGRYLEWEPGMSSSKNGEPTDSPVDGGNESGSQEGDESAETHRMSERERAESGIIERTPDRAGALGDIPADADGAADVGAQRRESAQSDVQNLMKAGQYADAILKIEELQKAKPDPFEARRLREDLARCYYSLGKQALGDKDFDKAIGLMKRAGETDGAEPDLFCGLGEAYYLRGPQKTAGKDDYELARQALEKALKLDKDHLASYDILGLTYLRTGNVIKAAECFQTIIKKSPKSREAEKARTALRSNGLKVPE